MANDDLELGVHVFANPDAAAQVDQVAAALARFRAESAALSGGTTNAGAEINVAIGAFQRLGQTIDVTNARAVAGFEQVGKSITNGLFALGATGQQLDRISAAVTRVQQAAGSAGLNNLVPPSLAPNLSGTSFATRRAADAVASLSFAANSGKITMQSLSLGAGSVATEMLALSGATLGTATIAGALVTVGFSLAGVLADIGNKAAIAELALENLRKQEEKNASTEALRNSLKSTNADLNEALKKQQALQQAGVSAAAPDAFGAAKGAIPFDPRQAQLAAVNQQVIDLRQQAAATLIELEKRGGAVQKQFAETQDRLDDETIKLSVQRTQGAFAARRVAAETEFEREAKRLGGLATIEGQQKDAVDAARRHRDEQLRDIDLEETQRLADLQTAAQEKAAKSREEAALAGNKATLEGTEAALKVSLDARAITQRQFIAQELAARKAANAADEKDQLETARTTRDAELQRLKTVAGPEGIQKRKDAEKTFAADVAKIHADTRAKDAAADQRGAEDAAALARRLAETVERANVATLEEQGRFVAAAQLQVKQELDASIAEAEAAGPSGAGQAADLRRRRGAILAQGQARETQGQATASLSAFENELKQIQALSDAGAISQTEAQDRVLAAYERVHKVLGTLIPQLQQIAETTQDPATKQAVDDLTTRYLEFGAAIAHLNDQFAELKKTAIDATQSALANFFVGAAKLGSQSHVEINALAGELSNAKFELNQLLSIPVNERTSSQTARITQLRGEVESLTVSLNNSKQAITSWKTLFVNGIQDVLDALIKLSAQMLATQIVGGVTGLFGGGFGVDKGTGASDFFGVYGGHAAGGLIHGPGGRDRVPGMLTAGEFVVREPAVRALGTDFMETINRAGFGGAPLALRRAPRHFADGGLVARDSGGGAPGASHTRVSIEHTPDYVARIMESPRGEQAIVQAIARNPRAVAAAIGLARPR